MSAFSQPISPRQLEGLVSDPELASAVAQILAGQAPTAFRDQLVMFAGPQLPAGFAQVSGDPDSYGGDLFVMASPVFAQSNTTSSYALLGGSLYSLSYSSTVSNLFRRLNTATGVWETQTTNPAYIGSAAYGASGAGFMVPLADGRLFTGAYGLSSTGALAHVFTPGNANWTQVANMPTATRGATGLQLKDGRVLVMSSSQHWHIYDPATNTWPVQNQLYTATLPLSGLPNTGPSVCLLPSGKVLLATGSQYAVFDPGTSIWSAVGTLPDGLSCGAQAGLIGTSTGALCITNGAAASYAPAPVLLFNEAAGTWMTGSVKTPLPGSSLPAPHPNGGFVAGHLYGLARYVAGYAPVGVVLGRKT